MNQAGQRVVKSAFEVAQLRSGITFLCLSLSSAWSLIIIFSEDSLKKKNHLTAAPTTLTIPHSLCSVNDPNSSLQLLSLKYLISIKMSYHKIYEHPGLALTAYAHYISDL